MEILSWVRALLPNWAIVLGAAAAVGAVSSVVSVLVYREVVVRGR